jgi:membrane-bound serine protease (ClpP class)
MNFELLAILLLVIGCGLIVAEVFIPSGGMILVMCVITFIASIWCAYKAWWGDSPGYFTAYIVSLLVLIPGVLAGVYKVLSDTKVGDRILLSAPDLQDVTPYQQEEAHLAQFVGKRGVALTLLTPGGMVRVDGERLHGFSEGMMIQPGASIEVLAVRGTRVLVREATDSAVAEATPAAAGEELLATDEGLRSPPAPLDFDVPQG